MFTANNFINSSKNRFYINRSGLATRALLAAQAKKENCTSVIIAKNTDKLHEVYALARIFEQGMSKNSLAPDMPVWEYPVLLAPGFKARPENTPMHMAFFYALSYSAPKIVIADIKNLLVRTIPRNFFEHRILELALGQDFSPDLVLEQMYEWGYERTQMVTNPGEISQRGDILDIFPAGYPNPCRIEFFGDTIDGLRIFDAETQRSKKEINEIKLIPASPVIKDKVSLEEGIKRIDLLFKEKKLSENDSYSLKKQLEKGGEGILPAIFWKNSCLFEEWLPKNSIWFIEDEEEKVKVLDEVYAQLKALLEDSSSNFTQPAKITLRRPADTAAPDPAHKALEVSTGKPPWDSFKAVFFDEFGLEEQGISLPEKKLHDFTDLFPLPCDKDRPLQTLFAAIKKMKSDYAQVLLVFSSARKRDKFLELTASEGIFIKTVYEAGQKGIFALISPYSRGAELGWAKIIILGEDILYPRAERQKRRSTVAFKGLDSFETLKTGDFLVHKDYGIGKFGGLHHICLNDAENDFLLLEYQGQDKLYVPVDRLGLIQRFKGPDGFAPLLDKLGSNVWLTGKEKARKAIEKIAQDLVAMYAYRKVAKSFHYSPPDDLYREFEATFGFEETPDQAAAIADVLEDMEKNLPMDRLVCGDVGFGKTEVALRAAFRAAEEGRQVALLCPTTVLAEQHYQTFRSRLAGFPVRVGLLSRFVPKTRQKEILNNCANGQIDILIGTHRLLSNDVKLPNLALLILDEEQRFGVRHKEKLKSLKKNVDVLTLTATPIPRTLQLSMSGIRDLSVIETAPAERKPVVSAVIQKDEQVLKKIIENELMRKGQVFWVYNRVQGIEKVLEYVQKLAPNAKTAAAHGQMPEKELEKVMRSFWHGDIDILVCTSIIESGLDFPNANTLIADQAQMFGLGQLYQLRGRVGRSDRQAYAYFIVPDKRHISETAEERLRVILNMDYLGAGFQVAMEDLRLRGAGNILGEVQSGHMTRVGLDLYLEMLEEEVARQKGMPQIAIAEPEINLGISAHIPENYIADGQERLKYYKKLTSAANSAAREAISFEIRDRFGNFPQEFKNFLAILDFKHFISALQVERADIHSLSIRLNWPESQTVISPKAVKQLVENNKNIRLLPPSSLVFSFSKEDSLQKALDRLKNILDTLKN